MNRPKKPTPHLTDLTIEQAEALTQFRLKNGRDWKQKLMDGWMKAAYPGPLQQIRNQFGPEWLQGLRIED